MNLNQSLNLSNKVKIERQKSLIEPVIKNPFVHKINLTLTEKLKLCFNGVFLMPIRVIFITIVSICAISIAYVITVGYSDEELREKPFNGWRRQLKKVLRFCGRACAFFFGFHKIKKNGVRATREEATIFAAGPHSSFLDAFVFFILGLPGGVSRYENSQIPLFGRLVKASQFILVKREDAKNKSLTIEEIKRRSNPDSDWPQLLIFPEGTTTNGSCLITFKPGAFIPGLPVQPIAVEYPNKNDITRWTWQGLSAFKVMLYTLCQFNNKLEVTYLPVYYPNEKEKNDSKLFANNFRSKIAEYLNIMTTFHTFEDCRLMLKARELNLPFESGLIEFEKIKEKLNINYDNCQEILKKFTSYARKSDGKMSLNEFSSYLCLPPTGAVVQVFNMYDRDADGYIDFREFLIGLSLLSQPVNTEDTLKLAFSMFDTTEKGFIDLQDLQTILFSAFSMSSDDVEVLFKKINKKNDNFITYDELKSFAYEKPEYARIFLVYNEFKILNSNIEVENLAKNKQESLAELESKKIAPNKITKRLTGDKMKTDSQTSVDEEKKSN